MIHIRDVRCVHVPAYGRVYLVYIKYCLQYVHNILYVHLFLLQSYKKRYFKNNIININEAFVNKLIIK
jgi:hypothetical protein